MTRLAAAFVLAALLVPLSLAACGKAVGETIQDATITTRVKTALLNDPEIGALRIDVDTALGVVTLTGTVGSEAEKARATDLARAVPGVKDVRVDLAVRPPSGRG
jgi:hyperosmotically inducible protein